jgi:beta-lactamase class A
MKHERDFVLDFNSAPDPALQAKFVAIDEKLCAEFGISDAQREIGLMDLRTGRLAMIHPDRIEYAASVPKIGILLAYFQLHPEAADKLDATTRHELGLMIKISSNEMAAKYSEMIGLRAIQEILNAQGFYDAAHGGGIWVGKHYGKSGERIGDPIGNNSHAATVRQLLRFYLLLDQERLVSRAASRRMREIFESPDIPHEENKFLKGLSGRNLKVLRKSGTWENWMHDTALIEGQGRKYILVAMTNHPKGDEYLEALAHSVDDLMSK